MNFVVVVGVCVCLFRNNKIKGPMCSHALIFLQKLKVVVEENLSVKRP